MLRRAVAVRLCSAVALCSAALLVLVRIAHLRSQTPGNPSDSRRARQNLPAAAAMAASALGLQARLGAGLDGSRGWHDAALTSASPCLQGVELLSGADGKLPRVAAEQALEGKTVAIYFSAHW